MIARRPLSALLVATALFTACRKPEVTAYRVPKEKEPEMAAAPATAPAAGAAAPAAPAMASTAVPTSQGAGLAWTAPTHWKSIPASAMRKATYKIAGDGGTEAELSITAFPGDVGGELMNLNRWRGQLQLPPVAEAEFATAVTRREHNGLKFGLVDLAGSSQRLLGAWVPFAGSTWFFKLTGPDALLAKEKANFETFIASVKPAGSAP